jgi:hypothetical protein
MRTKADLIPPAELTALDRTLCGAAWSTLSDSRGPRCRQPPVPSSLRALPVRGTDHPVCSTHQGQPSHDLARPQPATGLPRPLRGQFARRPLQPGGDLVDRELAVGHVHREAIQVDVAHVQLPTVPLVEDQRRVHGRPLVAI